MTAPPKESREILKSLRHSIITVVKPSQSPDFYSLLLEFRALGNNLRLTDHDVQLDRLWATIEGDDFLLFESVLLVVRDVGLGT